MAVGLEHPPHAEALGQLEQLLVLVGGVEQHGVAGLPAAQHEHVVVVRADHELVDLEPVVVLVQRHDSQSAAPNTLRPAARSPACAAIAAPAACVGCDGQVETTSKPRARATGIWRGSKVTKRPAGGAGRRRRGGWRRRAQRLGSGELGGAVEAGLVDGHDGERSQSRRQGPAQLVARASVVGEPVDQDQRLGEGERAGAPVGVGRHRVERPRLAPGTSR